MSMTCESNLGTEDDNLSIELGDSAMSKDVLDLAKKIAYDAKANKMSRAQLCSKYNRKRAQITLFIYAHDELPPTLKWYFLHKIVGLKPLVELHKAHGDRILEVISTLYLEKQKAGDSAMLTKPQIENAISGTKVRMKDVPTNQSVADSGGDLITSETIDDIRSSIRRIRATLYDAAEFNQAADKLAITARDFQSIIKELTSIEQCVDDGDNNPPVQGDPTDQSEGSYIFPNMVDHHPTNYEEFLNIEDISQDPWDHRSKK